MWQPCKLKKSHENHKENEHVENQVFDVATAVRNCEFRKADVKQAFRKTSLKSAVKEKKNKHITNIDKFAAMRLTCLSKRKKCPICDN